MYSDVRRINNFFRIANKLDVENIKSTVLFTERQESIFDYYYIKKKDVGFIADTLYISESVIKREIRTIREKILKHI